MPAAVRCLPHGWGSGFLTAPERGSAPLLIAGGQPSRGLLPSPVFPNPTSVNQTLYIPKESVKTLRGLQDVVLAALFAISCR